MALEYYNGHEFNDGFVTDCSLGQFVQELCMNVDTRCPGDRCHKTVLDHHRQYVHGGGKMSIIAQREPSKLRGMQNTILMWSCCRICGQETQVMPMSDNTWKYSFGKYLELTFWSMNLPPRTGVCAHDVHKNHVRYFGYNDVALRIQYDPIQLRDVVVPKPVVTWKVEADLKLKNEQFLKLEERLDKFMASVRARIKSIRVESVEPEKVEACRAEVERLMKRANNEHEVLKNKLKEKYLKSRYYEIIPLNRAGRFMHEKALVWDDMFLEFERMFFPSEKDIGRLAALQLRKIFLDRDESVTSLNSLDEPKETTPSVEEGSPDTKPKDEPSQVIPSSPSLSANAASDIMNSVVEKDRGAMEQSLDGEGTPRLPEIKVDTPSNAGQDQATPIVETPVQPVELEEVKHLDLVVSSKLAEKKPIITRQVTANTSIGDIPISGPSHVSHEGVTSLESTASGGGNQQVLPSSSHNETIQESRIPRPVDGFRRDLPQRPPLFPRAQSQPHNVLRREQSNNSTTPVSSTGYGNNLSTTEHPKHNLGDPARALEKRMADRLGLGNFKPGKFTQSFIPRSIPTKRNDTKVSSLTKYFDQLGREFEKERLRERRLRAAKSRQARALPLASAKPTVEIYRDPHQAALEQDDMDEDTSSPNRQSLETSTLEESTTTGTTDRTTELQSPAEPHHDDEATDRATDNEDHTLPSHQGSDVEGEASDVDHSVIEDLELPEGLEGQQIHLPTQSQLELNLELPKHQKSSIMKMLTSFWSERSASGWAPLEYPFASQEHFFDDSDIVIREDEPSSVIALALSCTDYMHKIHNWREEAKARARELSLNGQLEDEEEASIEHNFMGVNTNIKYGFPHRRVKVAIKIYYAQSFDALRRKCGVADRFVESMSRCLQWDSKGGKTKSVFLKTLDDRFVLKSLSPVEFEAFLNFAQHYFAFTHQNLYKGLPSVIAKMFGLYQVSIRNSATGNEFNHNLLVMENLFYDREPNMRFDLKGSMRNRKIQSTGERDEVLQDENLVDIIFEEPIFVREHTKKLLKASVWNDTLFLSKQNVMDYSLMAGFNNEHCEIVVGIIDCIRTYTWDKKLETWIKDRGKNKPTITSPKDYRARFRIAMNTYILQAPNCWHQFQGEYIQSRPVVWQADGRGLGKGKMIGGGVPAPPAIPPPNGATASGSKSNGKEREREEQEQEQEPGKFVTAPEGMAPAV
ncbi:hypothetical protein M501DRAFT_1002849 [Patellaria atrata CBS 101060]|uniref:PIPK domain-containing protein n=1 Tax=Patellaria atrata CBS 101060 TaxID=1346257 RepID=A0A9P4SD52_9PEZI|nr:hypothetical protein M501DRAFT_1002849 [Patellaria atrata CBS 101060]